MATTVEAFNTRLSLCLIGVFLTLWHWLLLRPKANKNSKNIVILTHVSLSHGNMKLAVKPLISSSLVL